MKTSNSMHVMRSMRYFLRKAWEYKLFLFGALLTVPAATFTLYYLPPLIVADILDKISAGQFIAGDLWASFGTSLVWYAILSLLGGVILWRVAIFFIWSLEMRVLRSIHQEVFAHLMQLSANFHANRFAGSLVSQANKFIGAYDRFASDFNWNILNGVTVFFASLIVLLFANMLYALVFLAIAIVYCLIVYKRMKLQMPYNRRLASSESKTTAVACPLGLCGLNS